MEKSNYIQVLEIANRVYPKFSKIFERDMETFPKRIVNKYFSFGSLESSNFSKDISVEAKKKEDGEEFKFSKNQFSQKVYFASSEELSSVLQDRIICEHFIFTSEYAVRGTDKVISNSLISVQKYPNSDIEISFEIYSHSKCIFEKKVMISSEEYENILRSSLTV